jgi:hypothetical protein
MVCVDFLKGCGVIALVLLPGVILLSVDVSRQRERVEKSKRILSFFALVMYLVSVLHFMGFLYVKPSFMLLGIFLSLPLLTRFILHPTTAHVLIGIGFFFTMIMVSLPRRERDRRKGFLLSIGVLLFLTVCFWFFSLLFNRGLTETLPENPSAISWGFIPAYVLILSTISYILLFFFIQWYLKRRKLLWCISWFAVSSSLIAFYFFSWYLPLLAPTPVVR